MYERLEYGLNTVQSINYKQEGKVFFFLNLLLDDMLNKNPYKIRYILR